ncbi:MAG TPA: dihydrofolate reductase [Lacipirellulaceae bacterium]|jgi:dihydrofolate reductase
MRISILVAVAENGVIGRGGKLPWHLGDDLKRFKQLTMGHTIVMGRKTWESIGRPLPGRRNVVVSRQAGLPADGAEVVSDLDTALRIAEAAGDDETFVIGGAEIYRLAISRADRLYVTRVLAEVEGDTYLRDFPPPNWREIESHQCAADAKNDYAQSFEILERR